MCQRNTARAAGSTVRGSFATLGMIVHLNTVFGDRGGQIGIANVDRHVRGVLRITQVDSLVKIFDSVEDAIASFDGQG